MKDKVTARLLKAERVRQERVINLIASENYVSRDVLEALGSEFTNKYAEGYPGRRYYGGNEVADELEALCQGRAMKLFGLSPRQWRVNVQPLSGSPANLAVYLALLPPRLGGAASSRVDNKGSLTEAAPPAAATVPLAPPKIMAMQLAHGGHLTHGHPVSVTGKLWQWVHYGVSRDSEILDYEALEILARREKPTLIVCGYTAYPRVIDFKTFRRVADTVGAYLMVDMSHFAGLVAGGVYPSPFKYADVVTTTTHKTLRGPRAALIFSRQISLRGLGGEAFLKMVKMGNFTEVASSAAAQRSRLMLHEAIDRAVFPGLQGGPHLNQIAAVAVALKEADSAAFKKYVRQMVKNAKALGDELKRLGWRLVSDGTDTHLLLVDVFGTTGMGGKEASDRLERAGIIVNKNTIPFDTRSPTDPSGIRLGAAAETTRGKKEKDFIAIARRLSQVLHR